MRGIRSKGILAALIVCVCPCVSHANDVSVPATVTANATGGFGFLAVYTTATGGILSRVVIDGTAATDVGLDETLLSCPGEPGFQPPGAILAPGQQTSESVSGSLSDPEVEGAVTVTWELCNGLSTSATTAVLPFVAAGTWDVPATVQAASDGSFGYTAVFTAGPEGTVLLGVQACGVENIDDCVSAEYMPGTFLPAGGTVEEIVEGQLVDVNQDGLMQVILSGNEAVTADTVVLAPTVPIPTVSEWGLLIMAFVLLIVGVVLFRGRMT